MEIKNRLIIRGLIGFIIGVAIELFFWVRWSGPVIKSPFFLYLIMAGILGMVNNAGSAVYYIESWSTLRATLVHYISAMFVFLVIALPLGWFPDIKVLLIFLAVMTVIYFIIWISNYLYYKKTVSELNEEIAEMKGAADSGRKEENN